MYKISYLYPTIVLPGMLTNQIYAPNIVIRPEQDKRHCLLAISTGVITEKDNMATIELDIFHDGKSVIDESAPQDAHAESPLIVISADNTLIYHTTMYISNVVLDKIGVYKIIMRVYPHDEGGQRGLDKIAEHESYFYVSVEGGSANG